VVDHEQETTMTRTHKWQEKYYAQLNGATIEACAIEPDTTGCGGRDEGWPVFLARTRNGECLKLTISQDPEGNSPGFIFIDHDEHGKRTAS